MTQTEKIVEYINRYGSITTMEAFTELDITRLSSRVFDLRQQGVPVVGTVETRTNKLGEKKHYKRYTIESDG